MDEAIQTQGANARAAGRSELDNPYMKSDQMPGKTGEDLLTWSAKIDAWMLGWRAEDAMRNDRESLGALSALLR